MLSKCSRTDQTRAEPLNASGTNTSAMSSKSGPMRRSGRLEIALGEHGTVVTTDPADLATVDDSRCVITRPSTVCSAKVDMENTRPSALRQPCVYRKRWILHKLLLCYALVSWHSCDLKIVAECADCWRPGLTVFNGIRNMNIPQGGIVAIQGLGGLGESRSTLLH
jgi:hypothetical protein